MLFDSLGIQGAVLIRPEPKADQRGSLCRLFSKREFCDRRLAPSFTQESVVYSRRAGTLRGFHYQLAPAEEDKLITCVRGEAFDVVLDIRRDSPTYGKHVSIRLKEGEWLGVFVPKGCAHAIQTLVDKTEVLYRISRDYAPELARGFRWDSPIIGVQWPIADPVLSERDRELPVFAADKRPENA